MNTRNGPNGQQHQHQQPWETATFALSYRRHGPQQQQQQNQQHDSVIPGIPGHDNINDNGNNRNSDNSNNSSNNTSSTRHQKPRPIPSAETMKERWLHRNKILDEKKSHLLVHPHNGMADTGRNIAFVLHDRERRGPQALTKQCHWKTPLPNERHDDCQTLETNAVYSGDDEKIGYQSPSTVVETNLRSALAATNSTINAARNSSAGMEPINTHMDAVVYSKPANPLLHDSVHGSGLSSNSSSSASNITNGEPFAHESIASREEGNRFSLRRVTYPLRISREIRTFGEYCAATKYHSAFLEHLGGDDALDPEGNRPPSSRAVSTISVAFSPDGQTMASTHGDHTVKISCCTTGRLLQSLDGHPRTPWTVKYHPMDARILASGCLGHQVRVWNWERKLCLQMVRLEFAIISLSFHPTGTVLAIANGTRLHFWGIDDYEDAPAVSAGARQLRNVVTSIQPYEQPHRTVVGAEQQQTALSASVSNKRSTHLTEWDQRHMLRCVHFPPNGNTLIIGGVNPMQEDSRRWQQNGGGNGGMSFYLRLWDFDMTKALDSDNDTAAAVSPIGISMVRRAISNPRTFVPRALLYNDGGFDLSSDGKTLCACAELWLPDGVDNAMELLHKTVREYQAEILEEESLVKNHSLLPKCKKMSDSSSEPETQTLATVPLLGLKRTTESSSTSVGRSRSFRESMDQSPLPIGSSGTVPTTPQAASPEGHALNHLASSSGFIPRTPPVSLEPRLRNLSPPPPPGSRFMGRGIMRTREVSTSGGQPLPNQASVGISGAGEYVPGQGHPIGTNRGNPQPQPLPPGGYSMRPPHPLSIITATSSSTNQTNDILFTKGRYVPHVVTVSLDTSPIPEEARDTSIARGKPPGAVALGYRPRLGQLLEACPLDANKASAVTCVKFSPSTDFCLIGYGVREPVVEGDGNFHPVTTVYRVRGGMDHVSTMLSGDDDVNIARFHPDSGHSFVYGTKQGRVRVLSLRPWSFYDDFKREY